ncbi:mycofactocin biosynthesis peptidyl-dipeptidase MftE [Streptomyces sp. CA-132043]|uniref:mycofactocin biosynthesis peptidyl-dipeptidase MftE n=1 Tax=Streptomyces sp. CA-132043 TaxID=3240048 RepID=UPI003D8D5996
MSSPAPATKDRARPVPPPLRLDSAPWPDIAAVAAHSLLAVPLGATEQHGPHLPFTVDTDIAVALCERLALSRPAVILAPPVPYGSSGEHAGFPGTLSIGRAAMEVLLVELVRSADDFAGVVLVCAHGGNAEPVRRATEQLRAEGRNVLSWLPTGDPADSHAGHQETSAVLALRPGTVRGDRAEPGCTRPLRDLMPTLRRSGLRAVTPNGVLGDPTRASASDGHRLLGTWAQSLQSAVHAWAGPVTHARTPQPRAVR